MDSEHTHADAPADALAAREERARRNWWDLLATLYLWRRFIVGFTFVMAVLSIVIALVLPPAYQASTRLLLPEGGSSGLISAALGNLSSAASALLGGGGDYLRYLTILESRGLLMAVVDRFDLVTVYELEEAEHPREAALELLLEHTEFTVDKEYEFLGVHVEDRDPQRAADMANFIVAELNRRNLALATQTAGHFSDYATLRFEEASAALDSVMNATQVFQEQYGLYNLEAQTQSFFEQLAALRGASLQAEIQYEVLREQFGENNPQVAAARQAVAAAERKYQQALAGAEQLLPVAQREVPEAIRQYVDLERERLMQVKILEVVVPLLEQARFQERRTADAVQVVDAAVPPAEPARPRKKLIVILMTLSAGLLSVAFVLAYSWWRRNYAHFAEHLDAGIGRVQRG